MISILLPCYKSANLLEKIFFPSLDNIHIPYELILYNNGGSLSSYLANQLMSFKKVIKMIGNGENIGLNKALNECAKVAKGDYFFLPHTDMYILPNCLESLSKEAKKHAPHTFLFCSRSIEPVKGHTNHHIIKNFGQEVGEFDETQLLDFFKSYKDKGIEVGARMPFFGHRKLLDKMTEFNIKNNICDGPFDSNLFSYATDDDLVQTAWHLGIRKFFLLQESIVYHLQGKSNNQQRTDKDTNWPYEYFVDKWKKAGYNEARHPALWHPKNISFETRIK